MTNGVQKDQDHILLRRMADGDESALAALYDGWAGRVHTLALWILNDADEAEDVVEETFWQAWRTAGRFDSKRGASSTWLIMIARSRALDRLRARRRWADLSTAPGNAGMLRETTAGLSMKTPDAHSEGAERETALAAALEGLPPDQRRMVDLAFFGGLSHSEIAEQTAEPLGTVKTRIRLAMQKLRQRLAYLREEDS
ncbi:MAG TPA: sigma-70 family RNA polymerase sigma factor [Gemmatimonadales bacterium]|nr:sigma-70 family RNA polymerase sigma factor [Gemmatimonadales bacterium]